MKELSRFDNKGDESLPTKTNPAPPLPQLPEIQYLGGIKSKNQVRMTGIIMLEGKSLSVKPGDRIKDVLIQEIRLEVLTLKFNHSIYQISI